MKIELIVKDILKPRLTITPERRTLKVPTHLRKESVMMLQDFSQKIHDQLGDVTQTYRGQFKSGLGFRSVDMHIGLYPSSKKTTRFVYQFDNSVKITKKPECTMPTDKSE